MANLPPESIVNLSPPDLASAFLWNDSLARNICCIRGLDADSGSCSNAVSSVPPPSELTERMAAVMREQSRITAYYQKVAPGLPEETRTAYETQFGELQRRHDYWNVLISQLNRESGKDKRCLAQDIQIGLELLVARVLQVGAAVIEEPVDGAARPRWGLRTEFPAGTVEPQPGTDLARIVPSLVNYDVGYGRELALRDHQVSALGQIRGRLRLRQAQLATLSPQDPFRAEMLSGTVIMPAGGGKTRTMVASVAAAIEIGAFRLGDKVIVLDHTDRIHKQNKQVFERLRPYFRKTFGRSLKISEYKAENKDVSGDIIVVSLGSVNTPERREPFIEELRRSLGEGQLQMVMVDEVHHVELGAGKGKETWKNFLASLREVAPDLFQIGFTATPTGREAAAIVRLNDRQLMMSGVTPRIYLVKVDGENLGQLKMTSSGDFDARTLSSTLLEFPQRNQRIYESLDKFGLRQEKPSPSNRARLEPVLAFGADLAHAAMMARDYSDYFAKSKTDLGQRNLQILGENRGKISAKELQDALDRYRRGEIDAIAAVVSGETKVTDEILEAVTRGEIEAVFSVFVLAEGSDLPMFTHQIGGRPSLSKFLKGQERYRTNRRGEGEVTVDGVLLSDRPRVLFDVKDHYDGNQAYEKPLIFYGDFLGTGGHAQLKPGLLFDVFRSEAVEAVDSVGMGVSYPAAPPPEPPPTPRSERKHRTDWDSLISFLEGVLNDRYGGDVRGMAEDLGESPEAIERLLEGIGWNNDRWFLRRLATLLYQDRNRLVTLFNSQRRLEDEDVTAEDYAVVKGALALYEEVWGPVPNKGLEFTDDWGWGKETVLIHAHSLKALSRLNMGASSWRSLWRGLVLFFSNKEGDPALTSEQKVRIKEKKEILESHFFRRSEWEERPDSSRARLLHIARQDFARRFGGTFPKRIEEIPKQTKAATLSRWIEGGKINYLNKLNPAAFYGQIKVLLRHLPDIGRLVEEAVFEEQGWNRDQGTAQARLLYAARQIVARRWGGALPKSKSIDGLSEQRPFMPLTRWLRGENFDHRSPAQFFRQVRALLQDDPDADRLIEEAVFEARGWTQNAESHRDRLLLAARKYLVRIYGGVLPKYSDEIPSQAPGITTLSRWLNGGFKEYSVAYNTPAKFWEQVRDFLRNLPDSERLITEAIFEERGWPRSAASAPERMLLAAREFLALEFGGQLIRHHDIEGVSANENSPLARWVQQGEVSFSQNFTSADLYLQVKTLLKKTGHGDRLVEEAIFEANGWARVADNAREKLLLSARLSAARQFGGTLGKGHGVADLPQQIRDNTPICRWLRGDNIPLSGWFHPQIRALLTHENFMAGGDADYLIREAMKEESKP